MKDKGWDKEFTVTVTHSGYFHSFLPGPFLMHVATLLCYGAAIFLYNSSYWCFTNTSQCSLQTNTYQAVLITDGSKSYAVYIYKCSMMKWSNEATIGWNAGGELYANHPLSGLPAANEIACVHRIQGSDLNNVIYDLVPGVLFPAEATPPPLSSIGELFPSSLRL